MLRIRMLDSVKLLTDMCDVELDIKFKAMVAVLINAFKNGNKVLVCGNGGSLCDAMHFAEELTGKFNKVRPALPAIAITDPGHLTCVANDWAYTSVFSRYVEALGKRGDVLIGLSTSGNSANVWHAVRTAQKQGMSTMVLLGSDGGALKGKGGLEIIVPHNRSERIQEVHMLILHSLVEAVERSMFPELYEEEK